MGGAIGTADPEAFGAPPAPEETVCASGSVFGVAVSADAIDPAGGAIAVAVAFAFAETTSGALDPATGAIAVAVAFGVASPDPVCAPLHAESAIEATKREQQRVESIAKGCAAGALTIKSEAEK
ncbi:MAG: hypothetical protein U0441_17975 [Polyangiaceae bacterium]